MQVTEYLGVPLTSQKIAPANTATAMSLNIYQYREHQMGYDSGDRAFAKGEVIVGNTSAAVGVLLSATITSGAVATGNAAGVLRFKSYYGTFADDELIKCAAQADEGTVDGVATECTGNYDFKNTYARRVLVSVSGNTALMACDGSTPDQTQLQGHQLTAGSSYVLNNLEEMKNFKVIDAVGGSVSTVMVTGFF
jgi:hypothetical protein